MGAATFTRASGSLADRAEGVLAQKRAVRGTVTFSDSYATGGDTLDLDVVGLNEIRGVLVDPELGANDCGLSVEVGGSPRDPTLKAYDSDGSEVADTTDLSGRTPVPVWLLGT